MILDAIVNVVLMVGGATIGVLLVPFVVAVVCVLSSNGEKS